MQKTVDMSPTWEAAMGIYATVMRDGTYEGAIKARQALQDTGKFLDRLAAKDPALFSELREGLCI